MTAQVMTETRTERKTQILNQRVEEKSRRRLSHFLDQLHVRVGKAKNWKSVEKTSQDEKEKLVKDNPDEAQLKMHGKVQLKVFLCVYPAAWVFEFLLLAAVAEFLMSLGLYGMPQWVHKLGRFLVPTAVLVADAYFGAQLAASRESAFETGESSGKRLWTAWCVCWVLLLASIAGYTCYVKLATQETFAWGDVWLPLILAALSLFFHCAIVFGGEKLRDAKSYLSFSRQHSKLTSSIQRSTTSYNRERDAVSQVYRDYTDALELHNNRYSPAVVGAGPFDKAVVEMVNDIFGPVILQPAARAQHRDDAPAGAQHAAPQPVNENPTNNNGQAQANVPDFSYAAETNGNGNGHYGNPLDVLQSDVDGRIRNAESEVTA